MILAHWKSLEVGAVLPGLWDGDRVRRVQPVVVLREATWEEFLADLPNPEDIRPHEAAFYKTAFFYQVSVD